MHGPVIFFLNVEKLQNSTSQKPFILLKNDKIFEVFFNCSTDDNISKSLKYVGNNVNLIIEMFFTIGHQAY